MGVDITDWGTMEWKSDGKGRSMMSPFESDSTYLEPSADCDDVKALIENARDGGAKICGDVEDTEFGIFGWFIDPEGIKIELWPV